MVTLEPVDKSFAEPLYGGAGDVIVSEGSVDGVLQNTAGWGPIGGTCTYNPSTNQFDIKPTFRNGNGDTDCSLAICHVRTGTGTGYGDTVVATRAGASTLLTTNNPVYHITPGQAFGIQATGEYY